MKKLIFSAAVLAIVASCSKNEVIETYTPEAVAIGFSTLNDRVTKAANINVDASNSKYSVYAMSAATTATDWYITAEKITPGSGTDTSVNTYFWPSDGKASALNFYAFAPASDEVLQIYTADNGKVNSTLTVTPAYADEKLTLAYTVNSEASEDFTVATPILNAFYAVSGDKYNSEADDCTAGNFYINDTEETSEEGKVPFVFSHMLAKATISVQLSDALINTGTYLTLTGAEFVTKNNGVTVTLESSGSTSSTTNHATSATYAYALASSTTSAGSEQGLTGTQALMFAPHLSTEYCSINLNGLKLVTKDNASTIVDLSSGSINYTFGSTNSIAFEAGKSYAITITIDANDSEISSSFKTISFSSQITSTDWDNTWNTSSDPDDNAVSLSPTATN